MSRIFRVAVLAAGFWFALITFAGANVGSPTQSAAEAALTEGRPADAIVLSDAILSTSPDSYDALFVKAAALMDLQAFTDAAAIAEAAFKAAETDKQRLQAARLVSAARFQAGQFNRAEWWLRRGANNTETPAEEALVFREYQQVRAANPLTANLKFGMAPTGNFNGGSESSTITFEGIGEFILPPEQQALSGVEFTLDLKADYRLSRSARQQTTIGAYLFGRTYRPSSSAKRKVPDIDGDDYALGVVEVSLRQERLVFRDLGSSAGALSAGRVWSGGDPFWNYRRLSLSQNIALEDRQTLTLSASTERQAGIDGRHADTDIHRLGLRWAKTRKNADGVAVSLRKKVYLTEAFESSYDDYTFETSYRFAKPVFGIEWNASIAIGYADYEFFYASLNGRQDRYLLGSVGATWTDVSYFGFSPRLDLTLEERSSTVERFDRSSVQVRLGVASNF